MATGRRPRRKAEMFGRTEDGLAIREKALRQKTYKTPNYNPKCKLKAECIVYRKSGEPKMHKGLHTVFRGPRTGRYYLNYDRKKIYLRKRKR